MDFSDQPIVHSCMSVSPNIRDYFNEERYLAEVDQPELLTPTFVSVLAVNLLLDELAEIGLETNQEAESICEYPTELNTVLDMRTAFDTESVYTLLKNMTDAQFAEFQATIDDCQHPGDLLYNVSEYCAIHFPTDERWQNILVSVSHWWWSTEQLVKHINAIVDMVLRESDPNQAVVDDRNLKSVIQFLQHYQQKRKDLKKFVDHVLLQHTEIDRIATYRYLDDCDKDMVRPGVLARFADFYVNPNNYMVNGRIIAPFLKQHYETQLNCITYWLKSDSLPTTANLVILVGSYYADGMLKQNLITQLNPLIKRLKDYPELIKLLGELVNLDYNAIITEDEHHEAVTE